LVIPNDGLVLIRVSFLLLAAVQYAQAQPTAAFEEASKKGAEVEDAISAFYANVADALKEGATDKESTPPASTFVLTGSLPSVGINSLCRDKSATAASSDPARNLHL
jgi:hypothetical protein